jgi:Uncharacterized protein conserved in bacteria
MSGDGKTTKASDTALQERCFSGVTVPDRIVRFIRKHHVMTLATCSGEVSWCANIFYSYIPEANVFVFTSDDKTRHAAEMSDTGVAGASIVLETKNVGLVQGLQIQGSVKKASGTDLEKARASYLKRFPYAIVADLTLWTLAPLNMKLTDNRLGFGKKLYWDKDGSA